MNDIPGKAIGILLAVILCIIMPMLNVTVENEMVDRRLVTEDLATFIDTITDSRIMSEADKKWFEAKLGSYSSVLNYEVVRYGRIVNPDPASGKDYYVSYIKMDDNTHFNKGDKVSVRVWQTSSSTTETIMKRLTGLFIRDFDVTITGRVR